MFDQASSTAAVPLLAAAVYYLWPLIAGWWTGSPVGQPSAPQPFPLPLAVQHERQLVISPRELNAIDAVHALQDLRAYYMASGLADEAIDELIRPHLPHLLRL